tara:strand:+ start:12005 stop:12487 length:483 start_codon:yes stop_codon:yes gene_type:complete
MSGIKHLIECHCILPQYKRRDPPLYHKFSVYSKIKDGLVCEKYAQCNNCGIVHKVYDVCRSEIVYGKEDFNTGLSIPDMSIQLTDKLSMLLSNHNCDYATWEHIVDIVDEERWGEPVVIKRDIVEDKIVVKVLKLQEGEKIKIQTKIIEDQIIGEFYEAR